MALGTIGALIAGTVGSSLIGGIAAKKGADATAKASRDANNTERYIFDRSVELTEPQRRMGLDAQNVLASWAGIGPDVYYSDAGRRLEATRLDNGGYGINEMQGYDDDGNAIWSPLSKSFATDDARNNYLNNYKVGFEGDPGYQFRLDQGRKAINNNAAARGLRYSSDTQKAIGDYTQGMASQEFGNAWNRLAGLSGMGQTATNQQISAGQNYAGAYGQNAMNAGLARSSGYAGINNAFQSGINNGFNILGMKQAGFF